MKLNKRFFLIGASLLIAILSAGECLAQPANVPKPQTPSIQPREGFFVYQSPYVDITVGYQLGENNSFKSVQSAPRNILKVTQIASQSNSGQVVQNGYKNSSNLVQIITNLPFAATAP
jgi:hypothetical protein